MINFLHYIHNIKVYFLKIFPEKQIFLKSKEQVRFVTIPSFVQLIMVVIIIGGVTWQLFTIFNFVTQDNKLNEQNRLLADANNEYDLLSDDFITLEKKIEFKAHNLEKRQALLEKIVNQIPLIISPTSPVSLPEKSTKTNISTENKISGELKTSQIDPEILINRLQAIDLRQEKFLARIMDYQSREMIMINDALTPTGLSVEDLIGKTPAGASGGPFEPLKKKNSSFFIKKYKGDEPYKIALLAMTDWHNTLKYLESLPVGKPATDYYISSKFGVRNDPLRGVRARHSGIDLAAWRGTAVLASAKGTVIFSGWKGAYGKMVDIDHGNGFKTRYGHMNSLRVTKGDSVSQGQHIGDVGDTGRTTGTHLHFEVWHNGLLQNPLPYLKARNDIREIQQKYSLSPTR